MNIKKKILNLTKLNYDKDEVKFIEDNNEKIINSYRDYINNFLKSNIQVKFSFLLKNSSLQMNNSDILKYIIDLKIIEDHLEKKKYKKIILNFKINNKYLDLSNLKIKYSYKKTIKKILLNLNYLKTKIKIFLMDIILPLFFKIRHDFKDNLVLLDTFITDVSLNNLNTKNDRFYGDYYNYLKKKEEVNILVIGNIENITSIKSYFKLLKFVSNEKNLIIPEFYISKLDLLKSFILSFVIPLKKFKIPLINKYSNQNFINYNIKQEIFYIDIYKNLIKYFFFKKLKKNNIDFKGLVNWYENKTKDRIIKYSLNTFFPKIKINALIGFFLSKQLYYQFPTRADIENQLSPDNIFVISKNCKIIIDKFIDEKSNLTQPGRFKYLLEKKSYKPSNRDIFFVALPIFKDSVYEMLEMIDYSLYKINNSKIKNVLKIKINFHPKFNKKLIMKILLNFKNIKLSNLIFDKIDNYWNTIDTVYSVGSAVCHVSYINGCKTIIHGNQKSITLNPLKDLDDQKSWSVVYNKEELYNLIIENSKKNNSIINKKDLFFEKNQSNQYNLFNFT